MISTPCHILLESWHRIPEDNNLHYSDDQIKDERDGACTGEKYTALLRMLVR
jgi:hypothetical protein